LYDFIKLFFVELVKGNKIQYHNVLFLSIFHFIVYFGKKSKKAKALRGSPIGFFVLIQVK